MKLNKENTASPPNHLVTATGRHSEARGIRSGEMQNPKENRSFLRRDDASCLIILLSLFFALTISAQEGIRPLTGNINYIYKDLNKTGNTLKNTANKSVTSLQLPFKEDFYYAPTKMFADLSLWDTDSSTYVNTGHAIAPPSIGVATFDGLNKHGYPYTPGLLNISNSLPADNLTSKSINLLTAGVQTLQPTDSVALTFYYEARGNGDPPELNDSLILDLYNPTAGTWNNKVWYARGNANPNTNDTVFKRVFIMLDSAYYFKDGFKFRFRNTASTAGDFDHFHLDYIYLDKTRHRIADTAYDDITIGYVPTPLLHQYAMMPWEQYVAGEKAANTSVFIRNNGTLPLNITYENKMYDQNNVLLYNYTGGATPSLSIFQNNGWSNYAPHAHPAFNYTFAPFTDSADFRIKHYLYRSGVSNDFFPNNDTVTQYQKFRNYYAYDDGSAEAAYYVSNVGGNIKIAQKFTLNVADTLRALRIYFDPIGSIALAQSNYHFRLAIWNSVQPGVPPIYLDADSLKTPIYYNTGFKPEPEYKLSTPQVLAAGNYYIGFIQKVASGIGIGFDRNLNHMDNLYFDDGTGWAQSVIPGSLMLHPVFRVSKPYVGVKEFKVDKNNSLMVYPNPANDQLTLSAGNDKKASYKLINLIGQVVAENKMEETIHTLNTEKIDNGVYFLIISSSDQLLQTQKIIVQH